MEEENPISKGKNNYNGIDEFPESLYKIFGYKETSLIGYITRKEFTNTSFQESSSDNLPKGYSNYFNKREFLFSKFQEGIQIDTESLCTVTPEPIAKYIATRCSKFPIILDAFAGVGGNSIQFALHSQKVHAVELDSVRCKYLLHNAGIYGVADKIEVFNGDFLEFGSIKADASFISPPWGGIEYSRRSFDLMSIIPSFPQTLKNALDSSPNLILMLPKSISIKQLTMMLVTAYKESGRYNFETYVEKA